MFFWLLRRQAKQTVAIAAAREAMHQRAVATQQRSLTGLRTLHAAHRENLEALDALLAEGQTGAALDKVRALTRQESQAARRYADNPVADGVAGRGARRCGEAGVALNIRGTLPRDCTLPPVDLASLLYNLLSNAVTAAAAGPRPGTVDVRFVTVGGAALRPRWRTPWAPRPVRQQGPGHGFGQKILREIAARYDGSYTLEYGQGRAVATAMVCLPPRRKPWVTGGRARPWSTLLFMTALICLAVPAAFGAYWLQRRHTLREMAAIAMQERHLYRMLRTRWRPSANCASPATTPRTNCWCSRLSGAGGRRRRPHLLAQLLRREDPEGGGRWRGPDRSAEQNLFLLTSMGGVIE